MAITVVDTASGDGVSTLSINVQPPFGFIALSVAGGNLTKPSSVSRNGQSFTKLELNNTVSYAAIWYLFNAQVGTYNIEIPSNAYKVAAIALSGVDPIVGVINTKTETNLSSPCEITVTGLQADDWILGNIGLRSTVTISSVSTGTEIYRSTPHAFARNISAGASQKVGFSLLSASENSLVALWIRPAQLVSLPVQFFNN